MSHADATATTTMHDAVATVAAAVDATRFYQRILRTPDEWAELLAHGSSDHSNNDDGDDSNDGDKDDDDDSGTTAALRNAITTLHHEVALLTTETNMLSHAAAQLRTRPGGAATAAAAAKAALVGGSAVDDKSSDSAMGEHDTTAMLYTPRSVADSNSLADVYSTHDTDTATTTVAAAGMSSPMTSAMMGRIDQLGRRGRSYRQRLRGDGEGGALSTSSSQQQQSRLYMSVEDKTALLAKEYEQLRQHDERVERECENVHDLLTATVAEAERRATELRLEVRHFAREVGLDAAATAAAVAATPVTTATAAASAANDVTGDAAAMTMTMSQSTGNGQQPQQQQSQQQPQHDVRVCADALVRYLHHRLAAQRSNLDKLLGQCQAAEHDIARAQQQLRQSRAAGDAFQPVDFAQLQIANEQLSERVEQRNGELAQLKGMSTRTVQILNTLQTQLNEMQSEQARLRKECKSRCEYLARCAKEVEEVREEAAAAEARYAAIKAQHEAVKVPRIEEYIAQKAELYELQKALHNWSRKVEIAEGQVRVMRQQTRSLTAQRDAAVAYAQNKRQRHAATVQARTRQQSPQSQQQQQQQQQQCGRRATATTGRRVGGAAAVLSLPPLPRVASQQTQ